MGIEMIVLIKNGRILDPSVNRDEIADVLIEDGKIEAIGTEIQKQADQVIEAKGFWVMPGLIDLHVHLREPGYEWKETIRTGTMAAARGGYTAVCPMPNTNPPTDSAQRIENVLAIARKDSLIHVLPVGAVTIGQKGECLSDIAAMAKAGAVAISEDGKSVMDSSLYRQAMQKAKENDLVVMAHCEDRNLAKKGVINSGKKARELGVNGISNAVEDIIVARDILLSKETDARLHLCHCSTEDSVRMVKEAKEEGLFVSAEVCPHHFSLTEEDILGSNSNYKMNPPLRTSKDVNALKQGLKEGIMDVISTDHAPHHVDEKKKSIEEAPFGIVGSETAVSLTITELVEKGYLTPLSMVEKMSTNPAKILQNNMGTLQIGRAADITIVDPMEEYVIDPKEFVSKGKNTPFSGKKVRGRVKYTLVDGKIVYQDKN